MKNKFEFYSLLQSLIRLRSLFSIFFKRISFQTLWNPIPTHKEYPMSIFPNCHQLKPNPCSILTSSNLSTYFHIQALPIIFMAWYYTWRASRGCKFMATDLQTTMVQSDPGCTSPPQVVSSWSYFKGFLAVLTAPGTGTTKSDTECCASNMWYRYQGHGGLWNRNTQHLFHPILYYKTCIIFEVSRSPAGVFCGTE